MKTLSGFFTTLWELGTISLIPVFRTGCMKIKHLCSRSHAEFTECGAEPWLDFCVFKKQLYGVQRLISCWEHCWTLIYLKWWWADCEHMCDLQYSVNKGLFWTLWRKNTQTFLRSRWRQHYYDYCKNERQTYVYYGVFLMKK